jgi:hypothetical protein
LPFILFVGGHEVIAGLEECAEDGSPSFHGSFEGRGAEIPDEGGVVAPVESTSAQSKMMASSRAEDARLNQGVSARPFPEVSTNQVRLAVMHNEMW